jgi:hypothetical protein
MAVDSLRLDQILRRDITVAWLEGIAVLQTICRELPDSNSAGARFPLAMEVALTADGRVTFLRPPSGTPGVVAAGRLLGELLQVDVPVRLRLIQSEAVASTPAFQTIKELSDALAYFERPDTPQLVQQLFARAASLPDSLNPSVDLVDMDDFLPESSTSSARSGLLRTDEAQDPEPQRGVPVAAAPRPPQDTMTTVKDTMRNRQANLTIVAGFVGLVVLASGAFLTYGRERTVDPEPVENATAPSAGPATAATTGATPTTPRTSKAATDAKATGQAKPVDKARVDGNVERARIASSRSRAEAPSTDSTPVVPAPSPAAPPPTGSSVAAIDPSLSPMLPLLVQEPAPDRKGKVPPVVDETGELLYSRVNAEVKPPMAIRPHLPSEPPANYPADHLMVLELVVTGKGDVESVRLLTAPKTVNDFMIVSAAKAWLFSPARLNGRPVKYRHRIRFVVP